MTPLFILSLPRSGSTLMQRLLSAHAQVATVSEPWILFPLLCSMREDDVYAVYGHRNMVRAIQDFCEELPGGVEDYRRELREFAVRLYSLANPSKARYFLDKTPLYSLVALDLIQAFPDAKFIYLWRHPLAVVASVMETWANGKWNVYSYEASLFEGLAGLIESYEQRRGAACALRYEDLVTGPRTQLARVFSYLDLAYAPDAEVAIDSDSLRGRMGDPTGIDAYADVSDSPVTKWRTTLRNPMRKAWCRRYVRWIGKDRLAVMGYEMDALLGELDETPSSLARLPSDCVRRAYGAARSVIEPRIARDKLRRMRDHKRLYAHT